MNKKRIFICLFFVLVLCAVLMTAVGAKEEAGIPVPPVALNPTLDENECPLISPGEVLGGKIVYSLTGNDDFSEAIPTPKSEELTIRTGWQRTADGKWMYINNDGKALTGWQSQLPGWEGQWFYFDSDGAMRTGWINVNNNWYYLAPSGVMQTGWIMDNGLWYFLAPSGAMQTGWMNVDGRWYYLSESGAMQTGWVNVDGKWYYLASSGAMQTGWINVDGRWYYLAPSGEMLTNTTVDGRYLGADGTEYGNTVSGSVISDGNLTVIVGVLAAVVFSLGGFFVGRKQRKTVPTAGAEEDQ